MTAEPGINRCHLHLDDISVKPGVYYLVCTMGSLAEKYTIIKP